MESSRRLNVRAATRLGGCWWPATARRGWPRPGWTHLLNVASLQSPPRLRSSWVTGFDAPDQRAQAPCRAGCERIGVMQFDARVTAEKSTVVPIFVVG